MVAPVTTDPFVESKGSAPGAEMRALAVRTCRRHCRRSKATGAAGERPPAPVSMAKFRYAQASPPAASPSGIAIGAMVIAALARCPGSAGACAMDRHMLRHAR
ncbi:MAG TPA: hypothetical protein VF070_49670 [Streptosporangiaceae bacterium]